ncbi:tripartite tricarboxylate transporter substrate binding protein [Roseibaca sp. V10]|uniref:Tripartite tricarboxylate transporter substrate binding protein n=1 Tax=Roseinatronobacter domitianus TaxID=2940293 RepID=A0ABT0M713_9RHOB|nr:tripartite tricarboxylate transporter substrate binding protein [Roseibaca domitiana]MCL1630190.1 tripartite tricarboxylate transporter substrate binding protein [Roseibaca domitiana]
MIHRRALLGSALAAPFISLLPRAACASTWPSAGPIRLVVAQGGGGNADVVARILVEALEPVLGQSIVVENNGTASGMRATEDVSTAAPDGYTLLVGTSSQLVHNIALFDPLPVDIETTLRGVAMINKVPMVMCVPKDSPDADLAALTARILANPSGFQFGSGPAGTTTHISGALFLQRIGAEGVVHIPYPRSPEAMVDLVAGRLNFVFDPSLTAIGQVQGDAVRPMGVSAPVRLPALADVPTMAEAGLPGFVSQTWNTISAPAGTPDDIVMTLNDRINEIVQSDAMRSQLESLASIVPPAKTPEQVDSYYALQRETWIPVVRGTGVRRDG